MNKLDIKGIELLAFDADDTLWDTQSYFDSAVARYCKMLSPYGSFEHIYNIFYQKEIANLPSLGYGGKAFLISLIENAIEVSGGKVSNADIEQFIAIGREVLEIPAIPLEGVERTLSLLKESGKYRMVLFTKGDSLEQESKCERSGLMPYFNDIEIVSTKTVKEYRNLCRHNGVESCNMLMIGNSFKSDIAPVLDIGGKGILIPYGRLWEHEVCEKYEHHNYITLNKFEELLQVLL